MPVFISHRTVDDGIARIVYERLKTRHQIQCYLDDLDREVNSKNVTELIVKRLKQCTNLLAIVTPNTQGSWWVPFEVGVAREAPRLITSFTNLTQGQLPEYLTEWPVLRGESAIDTFATHYKAAAQRVIKFGSYAERAVGAVRAPDPDSFHRELKAALGQ